MSKHVITQADDVGEHYISQCISVDERGLGIVKGSRPNIVSLIVMLR